MNRIFPFFYKKEGSFRLHVGLYTKELTEVKFMRTFRNTALVVRNCSRLRKTTHNILRLEKKEVVKVGKDNLHPLPSTTNWWKILFGWSEKP